MAPLGYVAGGDVIEELKRGMSAAEFRRQYEQQPAPRADVSHETPPLGCAELFYGGRKLGDIVEISLVDRPAYPWGGDPAKITILKGRHRIRGTLKIKT
jgi:hypothetical protein